MKLLILFLGFLVFANIFAFEDEFEKEKKELIGSDLVGNVLTQKSDCFKSLSSDNKNLKSYEKTLHHALYLNCKILSMKFGFDYTSIDSNLNFCQKDHFTKDFNDTIYELKKIDYVAGFSKDKLEKIKEWTLINSYKFREICMDKMFKKISPEGLLDSTGMPPKDWQESHIKDDSRGDLKNGIKRGPETPILNSPEIKQDIDK